MASSRKIIYSSGKSARRWPKQARREALDSAKDSHLETKALRSE
jgi:hypothetical protein